ncbi:hypothetical protein BsIDN1_45360 [Bacillus safensis]|uniref:Uncharacterized protein n=1 Tax=Bacillus safensis TaxID=561879 RepID=A0A5S9MD60_BACIA|nr:hypothetical protein BsIDN1_45360 [Bacillus safensis]
MEFFSTWKECQERSTKHSCKKSGCPTGSKERRKKELKSIQALGIPGLQSGMPVRIIIPDIGIKKNVLDRSR